MNTLGEQNRDEEPPDQHASEAEGGFSSVSGAEPVPSTRRARREARGGGASKGPSVVPFMLAAALVIVLTGGLIWWFVIREAPSESAPAEPAADEAAADQQRQEEPGPDGVILAEAAPEDWLAGDCLTGFTDEDAEASVIDCEHSYDVQVLHWEHISQDSYPGDEEISQQAHRACEENGQLDQEAVDSADYELEMMLSLPSEDTWQDEDRRVNCLLQRSDQGQMSGNFVLDPEGDSAAEDPDSEDDDDADDAESEENIDE